MRPDEETAVADPGAQTQEPQASPEGPQQTQGDQPSAPANDDEKKED